MAPSQSIDICSPSRFTSWLCGWLCAEVFLPLAPPLSSRSAFLSSRQVLQIEISMDPKFKRESVFTLFAAQGVLLTILQMSLL